MDKFALTILLVLLPVIPALPTVDNEIHRPKRSFSELFGIFDHSSNYPGGHSRGQLFDVIRPESFKPMLDWLKKMSTSYIRQYLDEAEQSFVQNGLFSSQPGLLNSQPAPLQMAGGRPYNQAGASASPMGQFPVRAEEFYNSGKKEIGNDQYQNPGGPLTGQTAGQSPIRDGQISSLGKQQPDSFPNHNQDEVIHEPIGQLPKLDENTANFGMQQIADDESHNQVWEPHVEGDPTPSPIRQVTDEIPSPVIAPSDGGEQELGSGQSPDQVAEKTDADSSGFAPTVANVNTNPESV